MCDFRDIAGVIARIKALFPNFNPSDEKQTATMYFEILRDLPSDLLIAATMQLCADGRQFAPAAGEIRQAAIMLNARAEGIPDAWQAYKEVCEMPPSMRKSWLETDKNGTNWINQVEYKWSHELVGEVAHLIGWPYSFPTDNTTADRAQFLKAYDAQLARVKSEMGQLEVVQKYLEKHALMTENQKRLEMK